MPSKKTTPKKQPDILTTTAQSIGFTLGRLAVATGFERPAAKAAKKTVAKKIVIQKAAAKKTALGKLKSSAKKAVKKAAKAIPAKSKTTSRKRK